MSAREQERSSLSWTLARNTASQCNKRGLSLKELSASTSIDEDRLISIMDGQASEITLSEIAGLSIGLGVSLAVLLGDL